MLKHAGGYSAAPPTGGGFYPTGPAHVPAYQSQAGGTGTGFYDRPSRGGRGGARSRERGSPKYEEFKEPDPGTCNLHQSNDFIYINILVILSCLL